MPERTTYRATVGINFPMPSGEEVRIEAGEEVPEYAMVRWPHYLERGYVVAEVAATDVVTEIAATDDEDTQPEE